MDSLFSGMTDGAGGSTGGGAGVSSSPKSKSSKSVTFARTRGSRGKGSSSSAPSTPPAAEAIDYDKLATLVAAKLQPQAVPEKTPSKKAGPSGGNGFAAASAPKPSASQAGNGFAAAAVGSGGKKSGASQTGNGFAAAAKPKNLVQAAFGGDGLFKDKTQAELQAIFSQFVGKRTLQLLVDTFQSDHPKHFLLAVVQRLLREGKKDNVIAAVVAVFTFNGGTYKANLVGNQGNLGTEVTSILKAIYDGKGLLENCRDEFETAGFKRGKLQQAFAAKGINTAEQLLAAYVRMAA